MHFQYFLDNSLVLKTYRHQYTVVKFNLLISNLQYPFIASFLHSLNQQNLYTFYPEKFQY